MGIQAPFLTFLSALFNGMMVEGAARWGYDAIWVESYFKDVIKIEPGKSSQKFESLQRKIDSQDSRSISSKAC